jgi:2-haloacid dehalogenase
MREAVAALRARIKVCMFDQYGTVVDMQAGLTEVVTPYLRAKGWGGRPDAFVTWWRRTHFESSMIDALLGREHTSYREIGHRAVAYTLERAGIPHTMEEVRFLVAQIERLRPFPEVPAALDRLRRRYRLAVLSNGDPDMLEAAPRSWAAGWTRCCSSPTTPSTASGPSRRAWPRPSSTAGGGRSG